MAEQEELRVAVSISRKINLGNFESCDIFLAVSGIEPGASEAEIEEALETGDRAFFLLRRHVRDKLVEIRKQLNEKVVG